MTQEATSQIKECPFCSEDVKLNAKKCKHCGETLDVALRAAEDSQKSNNSPNVFMNAGGGGGSSQIAKQNFPHALHFFLAIVTMGMWLIIWIPLYLFRNKNIYN